MKFWQRTHNSSEKCEEFNSPRCAVDYAALNTDTFDSDKVTNDSHTNPYRFRPGSNKQALQQNTQPLLGHKSNSGHDSYVSVGSSSDAKWHLKEIDTILKELQSHPTNGLHNAEASARVAHHGWNQLESEGQTPILVLFILQFCNLVIVLLLFASIVALSLQEFAEGIAILLIVILNGTIATFQEHRAGNALKALAELACAQSIVIREGTQQLVDSKTIVPGDIVVLRIGDVVPADIRLIESTALKVNEMLLTGESADVSKSCGLMPSDPATSGLSAGNMVFSSTLISAGSGTGVVVTTGMHTQVGMIAALLKDKGSRSEKGKKRSWNPISVFLQKYRPKKTPLQVNLDKLGMIMGSIAIGMALILFILGYFRGLEDPKHPERPVWLSMIMVAVSVAVSSIPEGLPVVVTLCLSSGTSDLVKENVLVRKIAAVETLGAASVICTDKTGTLTEGKMTAVKLYADHKEYTVTGKGFDMSYGEIHAADTQDKTLGQNALIQSTLLCGVLCNNTTMKQKEVNGKMQYTPLGNATEAPLIVVAAKSGISKETAAKDYERLDEIPFDSSRKMMITIHRLLNANMFGGVQLPQGSNYVACIKGAPNYILAKSSLYCTTDGTITSMTGAVADRITSVIDGLSEQALRVLALAIKPLSTVPFSSDMETEEKYHAIADSFVFLGLVASVDPERDGVREAIATACLASIRTVMITGDYLKTAIAIATRIELLQKDQIIDQVAVDCSFLRKSNGEYIAEKDLDQVTARTQVFARARPEDKLQIVRSLKRQNLIAAMTGDGVNDAPALKEADIGVAMGVSGTAVAKEASEMILTDDNFCSIVAAIQRGRNIYANIQMFVSFLLSTNFGEMLIIFACIAVGTPVPFEALHILVLNLLSDGMPAIALSLEKGSPQVMEQPPRSKKQPLIHGRLWTLVFVNAFLIASGAIVTYFVGLYFNFGKVLLSDLVKGESDQFRDVTCSRWTGTKWKTLGNCAGQRPDGTYIFPELVTYDNFSNSSVECKGGKYECIWDGLARAQTMVFVEITLTEVLRAYTVRHFTDSMFYNIFSNRYLVIASVLSVLLTIVLTNTPLLMDKIFGFAYMLWFEWLLAIVMAFFATFWAEVVKCFFRHRDREQRQRA